jgi:hypothetical protein
MPQGPIGELDYLLKRTFAGLKAAAAQVFAPAAASAGQATPAPADPLGNAIISGAGGYASTLAFANTGGQLVKAAPGMLIRAVVTVAGSVTAGAIYDTAATAAAYSTAQQIATIPNAVGIYEFDFPCIVGIVVVTGANGQQVTISYQ